MRQQVEAPLFLDVRKYNDIGDEKASVEVAGVFVENRKTVGIEERINPYKLEFSLYGEPKLTMDRSTDLGEMEYQGVKNMWNLSHKYDRIVWLSPPGGISQYEEGRMVLAKVVQRSQGVIMECRGIPINKSREELLRASYRLLEFGESRKRIGTVETLRQQPIGLEFNNDDDWFLYMEQVLGMKEVWAAIRRGDDVVRKEELVKVVTDVWQEVMPGDGSEISEKDKAVWYGAMIEVRMAKRGFDLMAGGDHGVSNLSVLNGVMGISAFNRIYTAGQLMAFKVESGGKYYCSVCGGELSGGSLSCSKCGLKIAG